MDLYNFRLAARDWVNRVDDYRHTISMHFALFSKIRDARSIRNFFLKFFDE